jgi:hypothetical protein
MQYMLGESWERLGGRRNMSAHLFRSGIDAWQQSGLPFENMLQGGAKDMHDKLGGSPAAAMLIGRLYFPIRKEPRGGWDCVCAIDNRGNCQPTPVKS